MKDVVGIYDKVAPEMAQVYEKQSHIIGIKEFIRNFPKEARILDLGCGSGKDTANFDQLGFKAVGIDASQGMIKEAKKRHPGTDVQTMDVRKIKFPDNFFDGVWSWSVITHLENEDKKATLKEVFRTLKEGGVFTQMVWRGRGTFVNKHIYPRLHFLLPTTSWNKMYQEVGFVETQIKHVKGKGRDFIRLTSRKN